MEIDRLKHNLNSVDWAVKLKKTNKQKNKQTNKTFSLIQVISKLQNNSG